MCALFCPWSYSIHRRSKVIIKISKTSKPRALKCSINWPLRGGVGGGEKKGVWQLKKFSFILGIIFMRYTYRLNGEQLAKQTGPERPENTAWDREDLVHWRVFEVCEADHIFSVTVSIGLWFGIWPPNQEYLLRRDKSSFHYLVLPIYSLANEVDTLEKHHRCAAKFTDWLWKFWLWLATAPVCIGLRSWLRFTFRSYALAAFQMARRAPTCLWSGTTAGTARSASVSFSGGLAHHPPLLQDWGATFGGQLSFTWHKHRP